MTRLKRISFAAPFALAALMCFALSCHYSWSSGCAADLKAGTVGNFQFALSEENRAGWAMLATALCAALATWSASNGSATFRLLFSASTFAVIALVCWRLLVFVEFEATKACLFSGVTAA